MTDDDEVNLLDYLYVIIKRKLLIAGIVILSVIGTFLYSATLPSLFEAVTTVLILPKNKVAMESDTKLKTTDNEVNVNTYIEFFFNRRVAMNVIEKLSLDKAENPVGAGYILGKGEIEKVPGTDLLKLVVRDEDPALAKEISNQWAIEFIKYINKMYFSEKSEVNAVMEKQYFTTSAKLRELENNLSKASEKRDPIFEQKIEIIKEKIIELTKRSSVLESVIRDYESHLEGDLLSVAEDVLLQIKIAALRNEERLAENTMKIGELTKNLNQDILRGKKSVVDMPLGEAVASQSGKTFTIESFDDPLVVRARLDISSLRLAKGSLLVRLKKLKNLIPAFKTNILDLISGLSLGSKSDLALSEFLKKTKSNLVQFSGIPTVSGFSNNKAGNSGGEVIGELLNKLNLIQVLLVNKREQLEIKERLVQDNATLMSMLKKDKEYQLEHKRLNFDYENIKNSYTTLGKKLEENSLLDAIIPQTVKITEPAIEPTSPVWPNRWRMAFIAFAVSLMVSIFLAFFIEFVQNANLKEKD